MRSSGRSTRFSTGAGSSATRRHDRSTRTGGFSGSSPRTIPEDRLRRADDQPTCARSLVEPGADAARRHVRTSSRCCTRSSPGRRRRISIEFDPSREDPAAAEAQARTLPAEPRRARTPSGGSSALRAAGDPPDGGRRPATGGGHRLPLGRRRSRPRPRPRAAEGPALALAAAGSGCCRRASVELPRLQPELDDHVFTVEVEQWVSAYRARTGAGRIRSAPASDQALMRMVWRVCKRAGVRRPLPSPAAARLRESLPARERTRRRRAPGADGPLAARHDAAVHGRGRAGRARGGTAASGRPRDAQASPDVATLENQMSQLSANPEWRRRESNPRPRTHRRERLQA